MCVCVCVSVSVSVCECVCVRVSLFTALAVVLLMFKKRSTSSRMTFAALAFENISIIPRVVSISVPNSGGTYQIIRTLAMYTDDRYLILNW